MKVSGDLRQEHELPTFGIDHPINGYLTVARRKKTDSRKLRPAVVCQSYFYVNE